jgi:hypothetical protein
MSCSHRRKHYTTVEEENWMTGETYSTTKVEYEWTTVDIDLHRYTCTQCKKIMYYSESARSYYEDGDRTESLGFQ